MSKKVKGEKREGKRQAESINEKWKTLQDQIDLHFIQDENDKVVQTLVYLNERIDDKDKIINTIYENEDEFTVECLLTAIEMYDPAAPMIARSKKDKLIKHLSNGDYEKYYKLIIKTVKQIVE